MGNRCRVNLLLHLCGPTVVVCVPVDAAETVPLEVGWAVTVSCSQLDILNLLLILDWKLVFF